MDGYMDVLYMSVKKIRGMNKIYFFIPCLVNSELQSVSCVQCVNLIYKQVKKKGFNRSVSILQIHRSIWLLIVRWRFILIFHSFSTFFFSHCSGDHWFYTLMTFIHMCNVVDKTWKNSSLSPVPLLCYWNSEFSVLPSNLCCFISLILLNLSSKSIVWGTWKIQSTSTQ